MNKKSKGSRAGIALIVVVMLLVCAFLIFKIQGLTEKLNASKAKLTGVEQQIERAEETTKEIQNEIKYQQTDEYIKDIARDSLGLVDPDEIVIVPEE